MTDRGRRRDPKALFPAMDAGHRQHEVARHPIVISRRGQVYRRYFDSCYIELTGGEDFIEVGAQ